MTNSETVSKTDIETFLKIAAVSVENPNPYLTVSDDKTKTTFITYKKAGREKIPIEYEFDKVFTEFDEYSYIYENIANNTIQDAMSGISTTFVSYGETLSEKHSILFGGFDCHKNLNTRGIFPRLLELLIIKKDISIQLSIMAVNSSKLIDISKNIKQDGKYSVDEIVNTGYDICQKPEIIDKITRQKIENMEEIKVLLHSYNELFYFLFRNENYKENPSIKSASNLPVTKFLYTFSNFIYVIFIKDSAGKPLSTITLCELAGNDNFTTQITNPTIEKQKNMYNTKALIENTNNIENFKKALKLLKRKYDSKDKSDDKQDDVSDYDAKLLIVLKNLSFIKKNTQFRIIGCITPNAGMKEVVKETIDFLFECRKITNSKKIDLEKELINLDKANKDDVIYALEERCRIYNNKITELNEIIEQKNIRNRTIQETYKKQVDILKENFNFNGDVNILLSGNQHTKEAKYAKKVREAFDIAKVKIMQNTELEKKVTELEHEIEKLRTYNDIRKNDQIMMNYYAELKEKNQDEQNKLKIHLEHSKEIQSVKEQNVRLMKVNAQVHQDNEKKAKLIENFSKMINDKVNRNAEISQIRKEIQSELEQKMKEEILEYRKAVEKEKKKFMKDKEILLNEKDKEIVTLSSKLEELQINSKKEENKLITELVYLYEFLMNIIQKFKKEFNSKSTHYLSPANFNSFIIAKDNYEEVIKLTEKNLNMLNFPKTFEAISTKTNKILSKGTFKDLKLDPLYKMNSNPFYNSNNNIAELVSSLDKQIEELKAENESLKDQISKYNCTSSSKMMNSNDNNKLNQVHDEETKYLLGEKERLIKKLEDMVNVINNNKILLNSQARTISKLTKENALFKNSLLSTKKTASSSNILYPYMGKPKRISNGSFDSNNHNMSTTNINKFTNSTTKNKMSIRPQTGMLRRSASAKML